jgi:hypothetical protein
VSRALAVLTACGLLTVLVEATADPRPAAVGATAVLYALVAVLVFGWVDRRPARRRAVLAITYVLAQLALGFVVFSLAHAGVGATLLLMVLVGQGVVLLPPPGAVAVTAAVPLVHLGMDWGDGPRSGLGMLGRLSSRRSSPNCSTASSGPGRNSPVPTTSCVGTQPRRRHWRRRRNATGWPRHA